MAAQKTYFVTGASGLIGGAVSRELIANGHRVLGLARSDESAKKLVAAGVVPVRGTLEDIDLLKVAARASDGGIVHCGFVHDFNDFGGFPRFCEIDRRAVEAFGETVAGTNKVIVVSGGLLTAKPPAGGVIAEDTPVDKEGIGLLRGATESLVLELGKKGTRACIMRLPPTVHGDGDTHGFVPTLIRIAREKNLSAFPANGANRWPAVHVTDAAHAYVLALDKATPGAIYNVVQDGGVSSKDIATAIGKRLNVPVGAKATHEEAAAHFAWLAHFFSRDAPATSEKTQQALGWKPTHSTLLDDLQKGDWYFREHQHHHAHEK